MKKQYKLKLIFIAQCFLLSFWYSFCVTFASSASGICMDVYLDVDVNVNFQLSAIL